MGDLDFSKLGGGDAAGLGGGDDEDEDEESDEEMPDLTNDDVAATGKGKEPATS